MKRSTFSIGLAVALLLGQISIAPAWALEDQDKAQDAVRSGQVRPFSQIKSSLERQFGGRVLDVEMRGRSDNSQYDVKLLTNEGDVILVQTDARTGRILSVRGGR